MNYITSCGLLIAIMLIPIVHAEQVTPIFSGYWYTQAQESIPGNHLTACFKSEYQYKDHLLGTPEQVANKLLASPPKRTNCNWEDSKLFESKNEFPPDFIFKNQKTLLEWDAMIKNGYPTSQVWKRDCISIDKNGVRHALDSVYVTIHPQYACPKSSVFGTDASNLSSGFGCTTHPNPCLADVTGRDLDFTPISAAGHVGLTTGIMQNAQGQYETQVIEVLKENGMNKKPGIYINSHNASFVQHNPSGYWGTRFGLAGNELLDIEGYQILGAAAYQMQFPFEYTRSWDWHPGSFSVVRVFDPIQNQWKKQVGMIPAKFRCDSFVYYAYSTIGKYILPSFHKFMSPNDIFVAIDQCRNQDGKKCLNQPQPARNHFIINAKSKKSIQSFFHSTHFNQSEFDAMSYSYIHNETMSREEKILTIFEAIKENTQDLDKFEYLVDILSTLKPIELTQKIIEFYSADTNQFHRRKLLLLLFSGLSSDTDEEQNTLNQNLTALKQGQAFLIEQLNQSNDPEIIRAILLRCTMIFPRETVLPLLNQEISAFKLYLSDSEFKKILIILLLPDPDNLFLDVIQKYSHSSQSEWAEEICYILKSYPKEFLSEKNKLFAQKYLISKISPSQKNKPAWNSCDKRKVLEILSKDKLRTMPDISHISTQGNL